MPYLFSTYVQLSKPPMGNKLGHGEVSNKATASGSSSDSQRPPLGTNFGEVPAPMEPMNPIPVKNSDKLGLPLESNSLGLENMGSDPGTNLSDPGVLNKTNDSCVSVDAVITDNNSSSNDADQQIHVSALHMFSRILSFQR